MRILRLRLRNDNYKWGGLTGRTNEIAASV